MKLGDYKGRKVSEPDFWKEFLIWRYSWKSLQINPKSNTLIFFSKTALTAFSVFSLKLVLNMTFNLNENCFSEKFAISRYLASKSSKKNCPNWGFWPFYQLYIFSFPWFNTQWYLGMMSSCFLTICLSSQCILVKVRRLNFENVSFSPQ